MKRAALALALAQPQHLDGLIDNVAGYTLDAENHVRRFTGLLVDDTGHVDKLLDAGDKRPDRLSFRLDAGGKVMLPGLSDAHGHVMALGLRAMRLDLAGTRSLAEAQAKLAAWAATHSAPKWIVGTGWNQESWGLDRFPTAADIDAAVTDRPVWLTRADGHAGVANSAALAEAGITAKTPDVPGGRIARAPNGAPAGSFVDAATDLVERVIPPPLPVERDAAFARAQDMLLGVGLTSVDDMGSTVDDWMTFRRSGDLGRLRLRIVAYARGVEPMLSIAGVGPTPWLYGDRLRMVGLSLVADGALGSRGAWLKSSYADAPGETGLPLLNDSQIRNLMSRAAMDGFQVAVDATGNAADAQVLGAIQELSDTYKGPRRWRVEHAEVVDPADQPLFGRYGVVASMQPVHQTSDRVMAEARLGPARLTGAYAWTSLARNGARLAFGSDFPVESPDPFPGIAAAISREDAAGQPPGGWFPEQRVSLTDALAGFTTGAAYAGQAEDRLGSLTPGRWADFILVDRDIFQSTPQQIRETKVLETWVAGRRAWVRK